MSSGISQQLLVMTGSSSNRSTWHDYPLIHRTLTPSFQAEHAAPGPSCDERFDSLQGISQLSTCGRSVDGKIGYTAFPEKLRKSIMGLPRPPAAGLSPTLPKVRQKCVQKPKYNRIQKLKKFTGCMQNKHKLSMENRNNRHSLCTSNGNIEPLCVGGKEIMQRRFHSNAKPRVKMQQCTLIHAAAPAFNATADRNASTTSERTRTSGTFTAMSTSSPTSAFPQEIERCTTATNALFNVILLQNVDVNTSYDRASISERKSMLPSYVHSFERSRPRVCMARTKTTARRSRDDKESDNGDDRQPDESLKAKPGKAPVKGRRRRSPRPSQYVCYFCKKVNKQRTNHKRHLIMKHSCRLDGTAATEEDIAQARAWSSKIPADQSHHYKYKEFVSSKSDDDSDDGSQESSSSSRRDSPPPPRQYKKAKRELSESPPRRSAPPSRSSSPSVSAPAKVRKVRFEVDEPVSERGESSRVVNGQPKRPSQALRQPLRCRQFWSLK